ncbi:MAG: hypothetical protein ABIP48_06200 [Planctomycetota bacterium]
MKGVGSLGRRSKKANICPIGLRMILFDGETDCYQPRPVAFFRPRRIILAKGSCTTAERRALVEKVCGVYPGAQVVDDPDTPHNKIDLGRRALVDRHNLGKEPPRRACGDGRARFPQATRLEAYRLLIDTIRRVRPELEIGLCLEDPTTFERLKIEENVGRCNCVL